MFVSLTMYFRYFTSQQKITFFHYLTCFPENFTIKAFILIFGLLFYKILTNRHHTPSPHRTPQENLQTKPLNNYEIPANKGCMLLRPWKMQNAEVRALESSKVGRKRSGIIICRDRISYHAINGAYFKHAQRMRHFKAFY